MNLHSLLQQRESEGRPIRVGLIGAGRFGTMYLAQARNIPGIHVVAIADINVKRAEGAFELVGWPQNQIAPDIATALANRTTTIVANADELFDVDIDVIVEATGNPIVGVKHALRAIETRSTSSWSRSRPTPWPDRPSPSARKRPASCIPWRTVTSLP